MSLFIRPGIQVQRLILKRILLESGTLIESAMTEIPQIKEKYYKKNIVKNKDSGVPKVQSLICENLMLS